MHLVIQGADIETAVLKEIAKATGAGSIEQVRPGIFRLNGARRTAAIAELCARYGVEWTFVDDDPG